MRAGLHTGECELLDGKVAGIAVHTGARVASQAAAGEVLVSSTVKDLVAGSGLTFQDRGTHELKGVPVNGGFTRWRPEAPTPATGPTTITASRGWGAFCRSVPRVCARARERRW